MGLTLHGHASHSMANAFGQMTRTAIVHSAPFHQLDVTRRRIREGPSSATGAKPCVTQVFIPPVTIAIPAGASIITCIGEQEDCLPTPFTPEEDAQLVNLLCDPETLRTARRHIKHLGFTIRAVRSGFENVIRSIEAVEDLNLSSIQRYHLRELSRQLPVLKGLQQRFNKIVIASREEAFNAAAVIISYESMVLDTVHERHAFNSLKTEMESIAQAILRHEGNAETLGRELNQISNGVRAAVVMINLCVDNNRGRIEKAPLDDLRLKTDELDAKVELHHKAGLTICMQRKLDSSVSLQSRWVFLRALFGVGQYCAGLAVAAFSGDTGLFEEHDIQGISMSKLWDYLPICRLLRWRLRLFEAVPENATSEILVASPEHDLARLQTGANKMADMGWLWNSIHMDLCKISEWLSLKFVEGQPLGDLELYRTSAENMRQHTRDLIDQLLTYSNSQF